MLTAFSPLLQAAFAWSVPACLLQLWLVLREEELLSVMEEVKLFARQLFKSGAGLDGEGNATFEQVWVCCGRALGVLWVCVLCCPRCSSRVCVR
jgi:hypothetical protein